MSYLRPEAVALLKRWQEPAIGLALLAAGLWTAAKGDLLMLAAGGLMAALGAGWTVLALRRMRFRQDGEAPGIVRITEAQIAYLGPRVGGFVGLPELAEIRLLTLRGRRAWRLRQADGTMLHIPVEADGAEALFDAFATLPGMDMVALVAALGSDTPSTGRVIALNEVDRLVWSRKGAGVVVR